MVDASEECVKVTNNNKLTEDNNDGLTPAQQNRRRR